jgi:hypothetical protein
VSTLSKPRTYSLDQVLMKLKGPPNYFLITRYFVKKVLFI